jgi:hypothetical protein
VWGIPELQSPDLVMPTLGIDLSLAKQPEPSPPAAWPIELEGLDPDLEQVPAAPRAAAASADDAPADLASSDSLRGGPLGGAHLVPQVG